MTTSLYIRFLSNTCPAASLEELAELALDMATVIVERSSLLPAILPGILSVWIHLSLNVKVQAQPPSLRCRRTHSKPSFMSSTGMTSLLRS